MTTPISLDEDTFFERFGVTQEHQENGPADEIPAGTNPALVWLCCDGEADDEQLIQSGFSPFAWGYLIATIPVAAGEEYVVRCVADRGDDNEGE